MGIGPARLGQGTEIAAYLQAGLEIEVPAVGSNNGGQNVCHRRFRGRFPGLPARCAVHHSRGQRQLDLVVRVYCPPLQQPFRMRPRWCQSDVVHRASWQAARRKLILAGALPGRPTFSYDLDHEPCRRWNCRRCDIRRRRIRSQSAGEIFGEPVGQPCTWHRCCVAGYGGPGFRIIAPRAGDAGHSRNPEIESSFWISSRIGVSNDRHG